MTRRWGGGRITSAITALAIGLTILALPQPPANAQAAPGAEPKISLTLRDTPLRSALELLFQQSGLQHAVEAAVPNVPVTLNLRDATFATALRVITRLAGVTYRKEGDVYVIGLRQPPVAETTTTEIAPPEQAAVPTEQTWEKIPVQFNSAIALSAAFGGSILPTEVEVTGGFGAGGAGGTGVGGSFGGGLGGLGNSGGGFGGGGFNSFGGGGGFGGGGFGGGGFDGGFGGGGFGGGGFGGGGFGGGGFGGGGFGGGGFGGGGSGYVGPGFRRGGRF
jgi:hypothetical protein